MNYLSGALENSIIQAIMVIIILPIICAKNFTQYILIALILHKADFCYSNQRYCRNAEIRAGRFVPLKVYKVRSSSQTHQKNIEGKIPI